MDYIDLFWLWSNLGLQYLLLVIAVISTPTFVFIVGGHHGQLGFFDTAKYASVSFVVGSISAIFPLISILCAISFAAFWLRVKWEVKNIDTSGISGCTCDNHHSN